MKHSKLFLSFAFGWMTVAALILAAQVFARKGEVENAASQATFENRIRALRQRVAYLEEQANKGDLTRKVVAPFEVVNRAGQRIFYVSPDRDVELWSGGSKRSVMSAGSGGVGALFSYSADPQSWASLSPRGLFVNENGKYRVDLGKDLQKKNYRLVFYKGDKVIAAIGQSSVSGAGIALVSDGSGSQKADMTATINGTGVVELLRGYGFPIVRVTEGDQKEGLLLICGVNGCNPAMVSAGTNESGVGVVATGPQFFIQGPTGASGSFLIGKKQ